MAEYPSEDQVEGEGAMYPLEYDSYFGAWQEGKGKKYDEKKKKWVICWRKKK